MLTAKKVASYFIKKANGLGNGNVQLSGNNDLTNLKLQKILYFAQVEHLKKNKVALFEDVIQAWQYGPVVADVYNWLKSCGAYVITEFDIRLEETKDITGKTISFLDDVWEKYNKYSAWGLAEKTHKAGLAWDKVYKNGAGDKQEIGHDLLKVAETF